MSGPASLKTMQWTQVSKGGIDQYGLLESTRRGIRNIISLTKQSETSETKGTLPNSEQGVRGVCWAMLNHFLTTHRAELIQHCRQKVSKRYAPAQVPQVVEHGVPLFLEQLIHTLEAEQLTTLRVESEPAPSPVDTDIGRAATMHGTELLRLGYTVDQVVHHYGDVCQAVTDLAVKKQASITTDEFRTLNRCLDEAIADAVSAFGDERENVLLDQATHLHERLGALAEEQRRLVDIALQTLAAIQTGNVGASGATGAALTKTLKELRHIIETTLPEIRLISGMTTTPPKS